MNKTFKSMLSLLLVLVMFFSTIPCAFASDFDDLTVSTTHEGKQVTIEGNTTATTFVSLLVKRSEDGDKIYATQTKSDEKGHYLFSFELDSGDYRAILTSNGIQKEENISITDSNSGKVLVRAEGEKENLLPLTEVDIINGETILIDAVKKALDKKDIPYQMDGNMLDSIAGEKDWQYLLNKQGGMSVPTTILQNGDEILLIDGTIKDPIITKLSLSVSEVKVGEEFTVTLEQFNGSKFIPLVGKNINIGKDSRTTNKEGQVVFKAFNKGQFTINSEPEENYIRPVPVVISVTSKGGGGSGSVDNPADKPGSTEGIGNGVKVYMRVEGYKKTFVPRTSVTVKLFDLDPFLGKASGSSATKSDGWGLDKFSKPTHAHAIVKILTDKGYKPQSAGGSRTFDFQDYGWSLYIAMIGGDREKEHKGTSGWMYRVNGKMPGIGANGKTLQEKDEIVWYFGIDGFSTPFTTLEAEKKSVKVGEEVKIKLTGDTGGFSTKIGPVEDAIILVNDREFKVNDEVVTTDSKGQAVLKFTKAGSYKICATRTNKDGLINIVRPEPISITVGGSSAGTTTGGAPGTTVKDKISNPVLKDAYEKVTDQFASEKEVVDAVKDVTSKLNLKTKDITSEQEAVKVINDTKDISKVIDKAVERVNDQKGIKEIAENSIKVVENLANSVTKINTALNKTKLGETTKEAIAVNIKVINKLEDTDKISQVASAVIKNTGKIKANLAQKEAAILETKVVNLAEKAVEKVGTTKVTENNIKIEQDKSIVNVQAGDIKNSMDKVISESNKLRQELKANKINLNKQLEKKVTIDTTASSKDEVVTQLATDVLEKASLRGMKDVVIKTPAVSVNLNQETLGDKAKGQAITLETKKVARESLAEKAKGKVGKTTSVVDIKIKVANSNIMKLAKPLEISLPYDKNVQAQDKLTVFYLKDNGQTEIMGGVYNATDKTVKFLTNHLSKYYVQENHKTFTDLKDCAWAKDVVEAMAGKGLIAGRSEKTFAPNENINRAEFAALVTRMLKVTSQGNIVNEFQDVSKDQWYKDSVYLAVENGLMNGKGAGIFDPEGQITRQEMAAVIANVLKQNGYIKASSTSINFKDKDKIADWAKDSVALTVREGVIAGMGDNTFAPEAKATRAQAAAMLYRLYDLLLK